jgi:hypothetical protein
MSDHRKRSQRDRLGLMEKISDILESVVPVCPSDGVAYRSVHLFDPCSIAGFRSELAL